ncbi:MAG: hypothetical protein ACWA44_01355 [Thiotrichales bacterium]
MEIHELKALDFEEAVDLLESRLVDIRRLIEENESNASSQDVAELNASRADVEAHIARLREMQVAEMSGEGDTAHRSV